MASFQQLSDDVCGWLNRRDIVSLVPGWTQMVETEIAETLRARCMLRSGVQPIDNPYITLPPDFASMESIRDATSGEILQLHDLWEGLWTQPTSNRWQDGAVVLSSIISQPATMYRLGHDCIEFLPHPVLPNPPDPNWAPQQVLMTYYAKPTPLVLPSDTNQVLENLYGVYLFGLCKYGALFELDDDRAAQMDAQSQQVVTRANLWHQQSNYSGAPYRALMATVF